MYITDCYHDFFIIMLFRNCGFLVFGLTCFLAKQLNLKNLLHHCCRFTTFARPVAVGWVPDLLWSTNPGGRCCTTLYRSWDRDRYRCKGAKVFRTIFYKIITTTFSHYKSYKIINKNILGGLRISIFF